MLKYATDNASWCGIPPQVIEHMKKVARQDDGDAHQGLPSAAAPPRPAGPTLSDALSAPVPDASNIKTGRGTFDTLTGAPLGAK